MGRLQHSLSKIYRPTTLEVQLELGLSDPPPVRLCSHFAFDIVGAKDGLFDFNLQSTYYTRLHNKHNRVITSLSVTNGKLNDCISSLELLLLNIILCVVR